MNTWGTAAGPFFRCADGSPLTKARFVDEEQAGVEVRQQEITHCTGCTIGYARLQSILG